MKTPGPSRSRSKRGSGFWFDEAAADRAVAFFETCLTHTKGEMAGRPLLLDDWERDRIIRPLFGWKRNDGTRRYRKVFVFVPRKNGKALDVDTPVPTPNGWVRHGDLRPGEQVYGPDGVPIRVIASTAPYMGPCHEVKFCDGSAVIAHARHEWITGRGVRETAQIAATLRQGQRGDLVHRVAIAGALRGREAQLLVHPYVLGAWLGDGATATARVNCADAEILERFEELGEPCRVVGATGVNAAPAYAVGAGFRTGQPKEMTLQGRLRALGVLGRKHIPAQYLRASIEQRMELLRGLIDTDGFVSKAGQVVFTNTSRELVDGFVELARSLGLKPTQREDRAMLGERDCGPCWDVQFWPPAGMRVAYVARKQERVAAGLRPGKRRSASRTVVSAQPIGERMVNCIQVEGGIYLAGRGVVPTHNSTLCAGIALYLLHADREPGAEIYSAAADREQAAIVFDVARQMVVQSTPLYARTEVFRRSMVHLESASSYKVLSADAFTKHGLNAHGVVVDEVHAQRNRELIDVLSTSVGSRRQPVEVYITTAGYDRNSICWELYDYAVRVLKGVIEDDAFLPVLFAADPDDDWTDEKVWAKANPGLGHSIKLEYLRGECKKAQEIAAYENTFKRLHLNIWTAQENRWLRVEQSWDPCATPIPSMEMLRGRRAWLGVDLSTTTDISAVVALIEDPDDPDEFDVLPLFFVPAERILMRARRDRVPYDLWRDQGYIEATEGDVVDYDVVRKRISELGEVLQIMEIAIDRWNSTGLQTQLMGDGFTVVQFGQGFASMTAPTKELERMLLRRALRHGGHPVLRWMADNVAVNQDAAGNIKPDKAKSTERIDGIVALVMAIGRATAQELVVAPQFQLMAI
jgi:phage terminase large subunit-like protein